MQSNLLLKEGFTVVNVVIDTEDWQIKKKEQQPIDMLWDVQNLDSNQYDEDKNVLWNRISQWLSKAWQRQLHQMKKSD